MANMRTLLSWSRLASCSLTLLVLLISSFVAAQGSCPANDQLYRISSPIPDRGGNPFCAFKLLENGALPNKIRVKKDAYDAYIVGLTIFFNDGTEQKYGTTDGREGNTQEIAWNPWADRILNFQVWGAYNKPYLGAIGMTILIGGNNPQTSVRKIGGGVGGDPGIQHEVFAGQIYGVAGRAGSAVDDIQLLFSASEVQRIDISDLQFDIDLDEWNREQRGITPKSLKRTTFQNDNDVELRFRFRGASSETETDKHEDQFGGTVEFSTAYKIEGKLPFLVKGEITDTFKVGLTRSVLWGHSHESKQSYQWEEQGPLPPHTYAICEAVAASGNFAMSYWNVATVNLKNGFQVKFKSTTQWTSVQWSEDFVKCDIVPKANAGSWNLGNDIRKLSPAVDGFIPDKDCALAPDSWCRSGSADDNNTGGGGGGGTGTEKPSSGNKIMVVGDSISHGANGDFTWRYRLWSWLKSNGKNMQFVGPFQGTHGQNPQGAAEPMPPYFSWEQPWPGPAETTGAYNPEVPAEFASSGHAAWWGRQAAQSRWTIGGWVAAHQPDYLLVLLGFNDMGWFVSGPDGLIGNLGALVEEARQAKSNINILVGNVVDRTFIGGRQDLVDNTASFNQKLKTTLPNWFRWQSPIAYVDVNAAYNCRPGGCPGGYDGLHPGALGEYQIASAFAKTLREGWKFPGGDLGVGSVPGRAINVPTGIQVRNAPEGPYVVWDRQTLARGYKIRSRLQGQTAWWSEGDVYPPTNAAHFSWRSNGQTWEYQVAAKGDNDAVTAWSGVVSGTIECRDVPGPKNIKSQPLSSTGALISWDTVSTADFDRYVVIIWDRDTEGAWIDMRPASGQNLLIAAGLKSGHRYSVWALTHAIFYGLLDGRKMSGSSVPMGGRDILIGGGTPAAPTRITATNIDPTSVNLGWLGSAGAAGYAIYYRSLLAGGTPSVSTLAGTTIDRTMDIGFLFPGTWNYEFCVAAYNGNAESGHPACITPPVYPGYETPRAPTSLSVVNTAPTTIKLTWPKIDFADGYAVWYKTIRDGTPKDFTIAGSTTGLSLEIAFLFPGTWTYQFCLSAYKGFAHTAYTGACVVPPVYPGYSKRRDGAEANNGTNVVAFSNSTGTMPDTTLFFFNQSAILNTTWTPPTVLGENNTFHQMFEMLQQNLTAMPDFDMAAPLNATVGQATNATLATNVTLAA